MTTGRGAVTLLPHMVASGPELRDPERLRLGAAIREARLGASLAQADVAAALGVLHYTVSRWETGQNSCRPGTVAAIARLTARPLEFFYPDGVPERARLADATVKLTDPRLESLERRVLMVERALLERALLLEQLSRSLDELRGRLDTR